MIQIGGMAAQDTATRVRTVNDDSLLTTVAPLIELENAPGTKHSGKNDTEMNVAEG